MTGSSFATLTLPSFIDSGTDRVRHLCDGREAGLSETLTALCESLVSSPRLPDHLPVSLPVLGVTGSLT